MVDQSLNIKSDPTNRIDEPTRQNAIDLARALIMAEYKPGDFPYWKEAGVTTGKEIKDIIAGKGQPLIGPDHYLIMMPFGEIKTSDNFLVSPIENFPADFNNNYKFPFSYQDYDTWGNLAEAKACNIAFNNGIPEYYIVRIQGKPDDPNSALISNTLQGIVDEYETASRAEPLARFRHKDVRFSVTVKKVDITKIPGMKKYPKIKVGSKNVTRKSLKIVVPIGARDKPFKTSSKLLRASWMCLGCDDDSTTEYSVTVNNLTTKKTERYKVPSTSKALTLEPGDYKISVATKGASAKPQYFTIKDSSSGGGGSDEGGGGFGIILLLLALAAAGYFGYRYFNQNRKRSNAEVRPSDRGFGGSSGNSSSQNNSSADDDDWS